MLLFIIIQESEVNSMKVIDVSQFNGSISWTKVKKDCDGAIIRVGYRGYGSGTLVTDSNFKKNIAEARKAKVAVGVYFVTQAVNLAEAKQEARYTIDLIKRYKLNYPIFIDSENGNNGRGRADAGKLSKTQRTAILKAFCKEVEKLGYKAGVYASESWFIYNCDYKALSKWFIWCAKYSATAPSIKYDAWQYTSTGKVNGVTGNVDISNFKIAYKGAEEEKTEEAETTKKTNEEIAKEVIEGKWGNGENRKKKLKEAGYSYTKIQKLVNKLLS